MIFTSIIAKVFKIWSVPRSFHSICGRCIFRFVPRFDPCFVCADWPLDIRLEILAQDKDRRCSRDGLCDPCSGVGRLWTEMCRRVSLRVSFSIVDCLIIFPCQATSTRQCLEPAHGLPLLRARCFVCSDSRRVFVRQIMHCYSLSHSTENLYCTPLEHNPRSTDDSEWDYALVGGRYAVVATPCWGKSRVGSASSIAATSAAVKGAETLNWVRRSQTLIKHARRSKTFKYSLSREWVLVVL